MKTQASNRCSSLFESTPCGARLTTKKEDVFVLKFLVGALVVIACLLVSFAKYIRASFTVLDARSRLFSC